MSEFGHANEHSHTVYRPMTLNKVKCHKTESKEKINVCSVRKMLSTENKAYNYRSLLTFNRFLY